MGAGSGYVALGPRSQVLVNSQLSSHTGYIHDWGVPQFPHSALQLPCRLEAQPDRLGSCSISKPLHTRPQGVYCNG